MDVQLKMNRRATVRRIAKPALSHVQRREIALEFLEEYFDRPAFGSVKCEVVFQNSRIQLIRYNPAKDMVITAKRDEL